MILTEKKHRKTVVASVGFTPGHNIRLKSIWPRDKYSDDVIELTPDEMERLAKWWKKHRAECPELAVFE